MKVGFSGDLFNQIILVEHFRSFFRHHYMTSNTCQGLLDKMNADIYPLFQFMPSKEGVPQWPLDEIKQVFNVEEIDDVLFGRMVRGKIGPEDGTDAVEFCPELDLVNVVDAGNLRQFS